MKGMSGWLIRIFAVNSIKIISLLLAVSIISFVLVSASPVDPVRQYILGLGTAVSLEQRAEIESYWGIDEPPAERYLGWLFEVLNGNLGESAIYRRPVADIIGERFWNSLALMLCAWILAGRDRIRPWLCNGYVPEQAAGQNSEKGMLSSQYGACLLARPAVSAGIFREAWVVPGRIFLTHRGTWCGCEHLAEALPLDPAGCHVKSDVLCKHCPAYQAEAGGCP